MALITTELVTDSDTWHEPEPAVPVGTAPDGTGLYEMRISGAQILAFADLVRRLTVDGYPQDNGSDPLRQELVNGLYAMLDLTPEPTDADGAAYLRAVDAGQLPDWQHDGLPRTEPVADWVARVHPEHAPAADNA